MVRTRLGGFALAAALGLGGCGSDGPPEQAALEVPTLTGTAAYDAGPGTNEVTGKGVTGPQRTASNSTGTNQYSLSLTQLTPPYALRWNGVDANQQLVSLYSVTPSAGIANITPLTTLLVAQLMGQDPDAAFAAFGSAGGAQSGLVTEASMQVAQAKVVEYLRDVVGLQVPAGLGSFVTASFSTRAGDPMFDAITAVTAKVIADGINLDTLANRIANLARLCIEESIDVTIGTEQKEFCPASKSATPRELEPDVLDYVFTSPANDTLTITIQNEVLVSGQYVSTAGDTYTCTGAACNGIFLGAPASDLTRSLTFALTQLNGTAGSVVLSGSLTGAIPGIALPILPCDNNRFFAILDDRTVFAECAEANDFFGLGGMSNNEYGFVPSRAPYRLVNTGTTYPERPAIDFVMNANEDVVGLVFTTQDENFNTVLRFYCEGSACNGVELGDVTVDTSILDEFHPVEIRSVTIDNTMLTGIDENGVPTGRSATLKGSFTAVYFHNVDDPTNFPLLTGCNPGLDTISMTAPVGEFNFCSDPTSSEGGHPPTGTDLNFRLLDDTFTQMLINLSESGEVQSVRYGGRGSSNYLCNTNCVGVAVSAPDTNGERTLTFTNTVLYEEHPWPVPGERTLTLNSGALVLPAIPP